MAHAVGLIQINRGNDLPAKLKFHQDRNRMRRSALGSTVRATGHSHDAQLQQEVVERENPNDYCGGGLCAPDLPNGPGQ